MIAELSQAAQAAEHSGITGAFLLDGAILIAALKLVETGISKIRSKRPVSITGPKAGESPTCRIHGEDISALKQFQDGCENSLMRIEGKVDMLLGRK